MKSYSDPERSPARATKSAPELASSKTIYPLFSSLSWSLLNRIVVRDRRLSRRLCLRLVLQSRLRRSGEVGKSFRLLGGKVSENLAIQFDSREFQSVHELRIVQAVQARRGADPNDPERAKISLLQLPAGIGEVQSTLDRLLGGTIKLRLGTAITLR